MAEIFHIYGKPGKVLSLSADVRRLQAVATISAAVPLEKWPPRAVELCELRQSDDRGVGDTLARLIGVFDREAYRVEFKKMIPGRCECSQMQDELNRRFPY